MPDTQNGDKKKRNLSPETRQRLSEAAKKRVAEGKMGGAKFGKLGGRPKKDRAASKVAEEAQKQAEHIIQVFRDAVHPNQPITVRLKAAQAWVEIEREEGKLALQETTADHEALSREELIQAVREKLTTGPAAAVIAGQIERENIVDGEVVEG